MSAPALNGAPSPNERRAIGVVGGLGPYAGLDLVRAIFDQTRAQHDQDHLPVALLSYPGRVPDRSAWLNARETAPTPIPALQEILRRLDDAGTMVAGIPCNTAHAAPIFDALLDGLAADGRELTLLHMVDAIVDALDDVAPDAESVGVLATSASIRNRLHEIGLEAAGRHAVVPDAQMQETVEASIFDPAWGLKAQSDPASPQARAALLDAIDHVVEKGAQAVILGCTELPLAIPEATVSGVPVISSTRALARALIQATHPEKLKG
ncbi:MAG: aspartate/glutamate racemase family protein [Rubricoccaceae bacterium]